MTLHARTDDAIIVEVCDAMRRDGKKVAEVDYGKHLVSKYGMHIEEGPRNVSARGRDLARRGIIARAEQGESIDAICSLEACSPRFVVGVLRAHFAELDARAGLARAEREEAFLKAEKEKLRAADAEVRERLALGETQRQIAKAMGSWTPLRRVLRKTPSLRRGRGWRAGAGK